MPYRTVEPFYDEIGVGVLHSTMSAERFKELREHALSLPKFGTDTADDEVKMYTVKIRSMHL